MIACDIDGVLADFIKGYSRIETVLSGEPIITTREQPQWDFRSEHNEAVWKLIRTSPTFWQNLPCLFPMDMAYLASLSRNNVVYMTRRDGVDAWGQTVRWLENHGIKEPLVVRIHSGEEKEHFCAVMGIDVLIDDSPKFIASARKAGVRVVKMSWQYNAATEADASASSLRGALDTALQLQGVMYV